MPWKKKLAYIVYIDAKKLVRKKYRSKNFSTLGKQKISMIGSLYTTNLMTGVNILNLEKNYVIHKHLSLMLMTVSGLKQL